MNRNRINIFIYRPDFLQTLDPALFYTPRGQSFDEWLRDQDEAYRYKVELIKRKLEAKNKKCFDY